MKVAFPVQQDAGLDSVVFGHFGSAPWFLVVDTATLAVVSVKNRDEHHAHGACNPTRALGEERVDTVVVGGIGAGALAGLSRMGISVHRSQAATVRENLALLASPGLPPIAQQGTCGGHGAGGDCHHG
jgi:predicted Fe-Mo cluster-binding NifX family protein